MPAEQFQKVIVKNRKRESTLSQTLDTQEQAVTQEKILELLLQLQEEKKSVIILTNDEVKELKEWLQDKKALGRAWSIFKTAIIAGAGTIVAWNVLVENGAKWLKMIIGGGGS